MTKIEWTDETWNPIRRVGGGHACRKVSPGCTHCYAERMQPRFGNGPGKYDGRGEIYLDEKVLLQPLKWRKPRMVFVCSMSDLFWSKVAEKWILSLFNVMAQSPHTFQILTKRPERALEFLSDYEVASAILESVGAGCSQWPLPNVWLGVSAEDQKRWDERVPILCQIPAAVRFVSVEPMLNRIEMRGRCQGCSDLVWPEDHIKGHAIAIDTGWGPEAQHCGPIDVPDWIICGGESGPKARPMHPDWARSLRDQCVAAGVPYFFKQWGEYAPCELWEAMPKGCEMDRVGKKAAGRLLDGRTWDEMPDVPKRHRPKRVKRYYQEVKRAQRGCVGKHGHETRKEGAMAIARMRRAGTAVPGEGLEVYRCLFCRKWHVGHRAT